MVYTGPTRTGAALIAAVAADTDSQTPPKRRGKKVRIVAKKPDGDKAAAKPTKGAKGETKTEAKTEANTKPVAARHAGAKQEAAPKRRLQLRPSRQAG